MKNIFEFLIVTTIFILICLIYKDQPLISHNSGQGWDGEFYYSMTEQILNNEPQILSEKPFVNRLGTPFLIAKFCSISKQDILNSAKIINLTGFYLTIILLLFWLRKFIKRFLILLLVLIIFMMQWYLPLRLTFYEPMTSDAWGAFFFILGLIILDRIRFIKNNEGKISVFYLLLFSVISAIGTVFRESNAVLAIAIFFIENPIKRLQLSFENLKISLKRLIFKQQFFLFLIPLFLIIMEFILVSFLVRDYTSDYSFIKAISFWFYKKSFPQFVFGLLNSLGPVIVLLPFFAYRLRNMIKKRQELAVICFFSLFFGYFAGGDTERIFMMTAFPVLLIWLGYTFEEIHDSKLKLWFYFVLFLQTIASRFYWHLPDFPGNELKIPIPFFTMLGNDFNYLLLYSYHGNYILNSILLAEYVFLFFISILIFKSNLSFNSNN